MCSIPLAPNDDKLVAIDPPSLCRQPPLTGPWPIVCRDSQGLQMGQSPAGTVRDLRLRSAPALHAELFSGKSAQSSDGLIEIGESCLSTKITQSLDREPHQLIDGWEPLGSAWAHDPPTIRPSGHHWWE
jgi:hypothetical protein